MRYPLTRDLGEGIMCGVTVRWAAFGALLLALVVAERAAAEPPPLVVVIESADSRALDADAIRASIAAALDLDIIPLAHPEAERARAFLTVAIPRPGKLVSVRFDSGPLFRRVTTLVTPLRSDARGLWLVRPLVAFLRRAAAEAAGVPRASSEVLDPWRGQEFFFPTSRLYIPEVLDPFEESTAGRRVLPVEVLDPWARFD